MEENLLKERAGKTIADSIPEQSNFYEYNKHLLISLRTIYLPILIGFVFLLNMCYLLPILLLIY